MKRLSFLTALLGIGVAKAQEVIPCWGCQGGKLLSGGFPRIPKPANGECPVCGTMAEPFRPENVEGCEPPSASGATFSVCHWRDLTPTSRRIDCTHCGVTFKQEAEKP